MKIKNHQKRFYSLILSYLIAATSIIDAYAAVDITIAATPPVIAAATNKTSPGAAILTGTDLATGNATAPFIDRFGNLLINQNTVVDVLNSTITNLAAGATFTGATVPDLSYSAVQYIIHADQNMLVYVDQSPDGINWDISDQFEFYTSKGNSSNTIQLTASYYRVRVTNIGFSTTTHLRLQVIDVPFLSSLPRSLDIEGNLRTTLHMVTDGSGFSQINTEHGELLVAPIYRLVGSTFAHPTIDPNFWTTNIGAGGSASAVAGELTMATGTTANTSVTVTSVGTSRHIGGTSNKFHSSLRFPDSGSTVNNTRQWGSATATNGVFFEILNGAFRLVTRNGGVNTPITNGSFNGDLGVSIVIDANMAEFDIVYSVDSVRFYMNGKILHTQKFLSGAWTSDMNLPIVFSNTNTGGSTTNVQMIVRHAIIDRLGNPYSQPRSVFLQRAGVDVATNLKLGTGNLHGVILSGITNNSIVTIYDNTTATGTVIWTSGPLTANGLPFMIDFKGAQFASGLSIGITGANLNVLVMYE